jgi:hypothetical protein
MGPTQANCTHQLEMKEVLMRQRSLLVLFTGLTLLCAEGLRLSVPALKAQEKTGNSEKLGTVRFPISCTPDAQ